MSSQSQAEESTPKRRSTKLKINNVLEAFEKIVEMARGSELSTKFFNKAKPYLQYTRELLHLSDMQIALLTIFVERSEDNRILLSEIADHIGCTTTHILSISHEIDELERLRYIRKARTSKSISYRVPQQVIDALVKNKPYVYSPEKVTDLNSFFDAFDTLIDEKEDNELNYKSLEQLTMDMLEDIKDSNYMRELRRLPIKMCDSDIVLFTYMAHRFVAYCDDNIEFSDIKELYDNEKVPNDVRSELSDRESALFFNNLIENVSEDGLARPDKFRLTPFSKDEILGELNLRRGIKSTVGLIMADTLAEKKLIYSDAEQQQVEELHSILTAEHFSDVQSRLLQAGYRKGFCCLFYGVPGTGKTETVYQLARLTGRNLLRVDVDKIKSYWVGESEKKIKALFDRYNNICRGSALAPILLFNEADAVLGVRMEGASRAVDKMENSLQNIILQEMESLEGIMIATTNLTINLDKAFERRFLYKIRFDKPTNEARAQIWKSMIPNLSDSDAATIASLFDLTGGEIENIARKHSIKTILCGNTDIDLNEIIDLCRKERISSDSHPRIGF